MISRSRSYANISPKSKKTNPNIERIVNNITSQPRKKKNRSKSRKNKRNSHKNNLKITYPEKKEVAEEDPNKEFAIDQIIARRFIDENKVKKIYYRVKWSNFDNNHNTWESLEGLIQDNVFEYIFDYENKTIKEKMDLIKKYRKSDKALNEINQNSLEESEEAEEVVNFKHDFADFNPDFKECFDRCEFGNLNDDEIEKTTLIQDNLKEGFVIECQWKVRKGETHPRQERYYKPRVIAALKFGENEEDYYKMALSQFDKYGDE